MALRGRSRFRASVVLAAGVAAVAMAFGPAAAAAPAPAGAAPGAAAGPGYAGAPGTYYAVGKPACKPAKRGHAACFADRRVLVKKGTAGARAFRITAGALAAGTIGPAGGLTPGDLATAYNLPTTGGSGQTLAIVDAYNDPNINADLQTFDTEYGLAACSTTNGCLSVVNQSGAASPLPANDTSGWSVEESLDVEAAHSICQGCKMVLVETNSSSLADLATGENSAVTLGANEVSNSYGAEEDFSDSTVQAAYNHPKVVITASAGDDGYFTYDQPPSVNQPDMPAAYNTVVAVGGTSLYLTQSGTRQSETVWNDNGPQDYYQQLTGMSLGATGGGCSNLFTADGWQSHIAQWASTACGTHRLVSDVSAVGDYLTGLDVYDSFTCASGCVPSPGFYTIGGTSLSSPVIAAVYALAGGAGGVPRPAVTLYGHMGSAFDVTSGGDGWCDGESSGQCSDPNLQGLGVLDCAYTSTGAVAAGVRACDAVAGYDGATGVGSPKGLTAFQPVGPTATIGGPTSIAVNTSGTWTATVHDPFPGGVVTSYTWMWGDGTKTVTTTGSASHTYTTTGSKTITLNITDSYGVTGSATYSVTVS